jgi:hypothetical protein
LKTALIILLLILGLLILTVITAFAYDIHAGNHVVET